MAPVLRARDRSEPGPSKRKTKGKGKADITASPPRMGAIRKHRKNAKKEPPCKPQTSNTLPQSPWHPPKNPQATFLGLEAELRLQIYGYVLQSSIIHVHHHTNELLPTFQSRFTWTPCTATNTKCPLLCANPKWSGLCKEEDRCTYKIDSPPEPTGFAALKWTCKLIGQETQELFQEFFLRGTVISIYTRDLQPWLRYLSARAPKQLKHLRRITLAGADTEMVHNSDLASLRDMVPNLEAVAFQGQVPVRTRSGMAPESGWRAWEVANSMRKLDSSVTVVMEGMYWNQAQDDQTVFRITREGKSGDNGQGSGWEDEDVNMVVHTSGLVERKRNAGWRKWWHDMELHSFV